MVPSIISRYVVREVLPPFCLTLLVFTFLMLLPPIMNQAEELIRIGVDARQVAEMLLLLVPQSLGVTIPMALLVGVLMALGRLSGDRETVAMQACGLSLFRILTPLLVLATATAAMNCYLLLSVVPDATQRFREILLRVQANRAEGEVKPRVFYVGDFPDVVLYVQEVPSTGEGWSDVFLADVQRPEQPDIYIAERGRVGVDRDRRTVAIVLENGERHRVDPSVPSAYEVHSFQELRIQLDAESLFPAGGPDRDLRELTIPELSQQAAAMRAAGGVAARADHGGSQEVLHSGRMLRLRAARRGIRREQPHGRTTGQLRARNRRHLRLLRADVRIGSARQGAAGPPPIWQCGCRTSSWVWPAWR